MTAIARLEDIEAWQEARKLTKLVYALSNKGALARDFELRGQIRKASVSTMANIAEGFDGGSDPEFNRFLRYALRSATQVQSHTYVALDADYIDEAQFKTLFEKTCTVKRLITGFMRYLEGPI